VIILSLFVILTLVTFIPTQESSPYSTVIGEMSVRTRLGSYRAWHHWFPLMEWDVTVFWGFDVDGNLIEVHIRKLSMS